MSDNVMVSIIMAAFNSELYIEDAIQSIVNQEYKNFELIVINDGSTDKTKEIIERMQIQEPRINLKSQSNKGASAARNLGLSIAAGRYIAIMDSDDISLPGRIGKMVNFLETHPEIGICGSWLRTYGTYRNNELWKYPVDAMEIKCSLLFFNPLAHSSVMLRKTILDENNLTYESEFNPSEDYRLWVKASPFTEIVNLSEVLVLYRISPEQNRPGYGAKQQASKRHIIKDSLYEIGIVPQEQELDLHIALSLSEFQKSRDFVVQTEAWLTKLLEANKTFKVYPEKALKNYLSKIWFEACRKNTSFGPWIIIKFLESNLRNTNQVNLNTKMKFFIKSLLYK